MKIDRLTTRDSEGTYFITPMGNALSAPELRSVTVQALLDRLWEYEDAEERGELERVVRCKGCIFSEEYLYDGKKILTCRNEDGLFSDVSDTDYCCCGVERGINDDT